MPGSIVALACVARVLYIRLRMPPGPHESKTALTRLLFCALGVCTISALWALFLKG